MSTLQPTRGVTTPDSNAGSFAPKTNSAPGAAAHLQTSGVADAAAVERAATAMHWLRDSGLAHSDAVVDDTDGSMTITRRGGTQVRIGDYQSANADFEGQPTMSLTVKDLTPGWAELKAEEFTLARHGAAQSVAAFDANGRPLALWETRALFDHVDSEMGGPKIDRGRGLAAKVYEMTSGTHAPGNSTTRIPDEGPREFWA